MKKTEFKCSCILLAVAPAVPTAASNRYGDYFIGGIIALLILIYLVYALIKPEKF